MSQKSQYTYAESQAFRKLKEKFNELQSDYAKVRNSLEQTTRAASLMHNALVVFLQEKQVTQHPNAAEPQKLFYPPEACAVAQAFRAAGGDISLRITEAGAMEIGLVPPGTPSPEAH